MSSSFLKPSVTPRTALATRLRASPWNLPSCGSSRSKDAVNRSPSTANPMPGGSACCSLPLGPWISTEPGLTSILTPFGIAIGFLPIRDIVFSFQLPAASFRAGAGGLVQPPVLSAGSWERDAGSLLPHVTEHFAADARLHRFAAGHHSARRGQDAGAESGEHFGDLVAPEIHAPAGAADPLDADDDALAARTVFQEQAQRR